MPTYVYECKTCEKVFEVQQRMMEDALTECNCERKQPVRRLIQPVAIAFKGEGFHINDYAPKSSEPAKTTAPESASAASAPESTSTESAPKESNPKPETPAPAPAAPPPPSPTS